MQTKVEKITTYDLDEKDVKEAICYYLRREAGESLGDAEVTINIDWNRHEFNGATVVFKDESNG